MDKNQQKQLEMKRKRRRMLVLLGFYGAIVTISFVIRWQPGMQVAKNFGFFALDMFKLFPPAFVLVGLFIVWVDRKTIERFFGETSGVLGYLAAISLSCTTLYPFIVVLPMAAAMMKKGGRLSIVLTYLGASAICRIPMTIFETSFLGLKFTIIRYVVSLPLIITSSIIIEKVVGRNYYEKMELANNFE